MELPKVFKPEEFELEIYKKWEESGYFSPSAESKGQPFCVIMPPPNANGSLHIGHAVFVTLEDIMVRYHRMKGKSTLWLPGADHAGFETQVVYQKKLEKEGRNWFTIPRDELYKEISDFTLANKITMENQVRRLGASCDWTREIFTLDERIIKIVLRTFKKLADDNLVYRGERLINWCVKHQTTLSDLEVKHEDQEGQLTYIKYPLRDSREFVTVATTRPETMLGDTAVAVNPSDERYQNLVGQTLVVPLVNREITIIADEAVEKEFGTGAVKVTPAHDPVDFEIGERHQLAKIQVIGQDGKITDAAPEKYRALKVEEARKQVVEDLRSLGLVLKEEKFNHAVAVCYKCNRAIEPLILPQWFIKMKPLAEKVIKAVQAKEVKFVTERFEKILFHWLNNIRDWNVSRQIVWGIRIPVWYCQNQGCSPIITAGETPEKCPQCGSQELKQETDVFDTWFSSGQWPFATLQVTGDFAKFYPTSVMETGWDILPFWIMRMLVLGIYVTGQVPFKDIYLHGLVRDKDRQKMSKSKGNVVNPLGVVETYGADALRMALVFGVSAGNDIVISEDKIRAHRNFANKIWNASRFVMMNLRENFTEKEINPSKLNVADKTILDRLVEVSKKVTKNLDDFDFHLAAEEIYQFFWHEFCDQYLEEVKIRLSGDNLEEKENIQQVLFKVWLQSIKLLHPFVPYVTEAVYQMSPVKNKEFLMIEVWPQN